MKTLARCTYAAIVGAVLVSATTDAEGEFLREEQKIMKSLSEDKVDVKIKANSPTIEANSDSKVNSTNPLPVEKAAIL